MKYFTRQKESELFKMTETFKMIETFEIINRISNYGRYFFNISPRTGNLLSRQISKIEFTKQSNIFGPNCLNWTKTATM